MHFVIVSLKNVVELDQKHFRVSQEHLLNNGVNIYKYYIKGDK